MNINLSLENILSLSVTSVIGLWLILQTVKIYPGIDIVKISINWFSNRPIILPSLQFLILPFFFSGIIQKLPPDFNKIFDNKIILQLLTTLGAIISIYIANIALESFRKTQEQKKIAKILIASIEAHLEYLHKLQQYLGDNKFDKSDINKIKRIIGQIQKDYIYESALKSVGIFNSQNIDVIYRYARNISSYLDDILNSFENIDRFMKITVLNTLRFKLPAISMEAKLCIIQLSKEIVKDNEKFSMYKKIIINEYAKNRAEDNIRGFSTLEMQGILRTTEILFKGYGLHSEIDASYNEE
jgi:hypothetical protein